MLNLFIQCIKNGVILVIVLVITRSGIYHYDVVKGLNIIYLSSSMSSHIIQSLSLSLSLSQLTRSIQELFI